MSWRFFPTGILHSHALLMADVTQDGGGRGFSEPLSHVEGTRGFVGGGGANEADWRLNEAAGRQ